MRSRVAFLETAVKVTGLGCLTAAAFTVDPAVGLAGLGASLLAVAYLP